MNKYVDTKEYFLIPKELFIGPAYKNLTLQEKLLYVYILNDGGETQATNRELGDFLGVSQRRVQGVVSRLIAKVFAKTMIDLTERKQVICRTISLRGKRNGKKV